MKCAHCEHVVTGRRAPEVLIAHTLIRHHRKATS